MTQLAHHKLLVKLMMLVAVFFFTFTTVSLAETESSKEPIALNKNQLSFYFQNIEVRTLLELIAKTSGKNFMISDSVKGTMTLNLKNVTWQQALNIILESRGLASRQIGNVIYISTNEDITQNLTKQLQSNQDIANLSPLSSELLTLKYTNAAEVSKFLKGEAGNILTARGEVAVDSRTNSIILRDVKQNLQQVVRYLKRLDVPAKQVSIEARIVEIDSSYESQLGVRFGISNTRSLSGSFYGANQLAQGTGAAFVANPNSNNPQPDPTPRLNFNLPANALSTGSQPASVGLALARLGPVLLDMELSALEEENHSQTISKPRVVTSNQQKALIQTGQEIPYAQATSSGATSIDFKNAVLSLEITPQITPDNKILLKLKATQDTVGDQLLIAPNTFGPPTINTQSVESYVMLNDNETVVVGGIYRLNKQNRFDRVPFFSSLPLLGNLFKHRGVNNQKSELLIFLTPKIIKAGQSMAAYKGS